MKGRNFVKVLCRRCKNLMQDEDLFCGKCGLSRNDITYVIRDVVYLHYKIFMLVTAIVLFLIVSIVSIKRIKTDINKRLATDEYNSSFYDVMLKTKCVTEYSMDTMSYDMDSVQFGEYIQDNVSNDESESVKDVSIIKKDKIEWLVLEKDEEKHRVLLFSKYILDMHGFNDTNRQVSWEISEIRKWLNTDFYDGAFSDREKEKIIEVEIKNDYDYGEEFRKDPATFDKVFLLSAKELVKYFLAERENTNAIVFGKNVAARETEYSKNVRFAYPGKMKGRWRTYGIKSDDDDTTEIKYEWAVGNNAYWLRDPIRTSLNYVSMVYAYGFLGFGYSMPDTSVSGVRPAIWVSY